MKVVLYRRLSKEDKTRTQHGFESQLRDINYYLESNQGEIIGDFKEFISGTADNKPELQKALTLCEDTGAILLVAKLDRLSRRVSQISQYMESKVKFKVAGLPNADNFQLHIYAALSEQEREKLLVIVLNVVLQQLKLKVLNLVQLTLSIIKLNMYLKYLNLKLINTGNNNVHKLKV